jgi:hypothetical protein
VRSRPVRDRDWPVEDLALAGVLGPLGVAIAVYGEGPMEITFAIALIVVALKVLREAYRVADRRGPPAPAGCPESEIDLHA